MKALVYIVATALTLLLISNLGIGIAVDNLYSALVVAVIWGLIMLLVRPVLLLLTLPINIITMGLFSFILNALLFWFISTFIEGFSVQGFVPALLGSVILSCVYWVLHAAYKRG